MSKSVLAVLALLIGISVRFGRAGLISIAVCGLAITGIILTRPSFPSSLISRIDVWSNALGLMTPLQWFVGVGPGSWIYHSQLHQWQGVSFVHAHNEFFQLFYEAGVVGLSFAFGWLWYHRKCFTGQLGGSLASILVCSLGLFVFHLGVLSLMILIGLATKGESSWLGNTSI